MIFVHDKGRLCNNILQYGHLYAWGREHGRATVSMRFAYKYQYFHICHTRHHHFLTYVFAKYAAKCRLLPVVHFDEADRDYSREEAMMLRHRHLVVQGWYARWYDLFLKYKEEILQLFAFDKKTKQAVDGMLGNLPKADIRLGLHIRRGDYKTWHNGRFFFSDEQYIEVVHRFLALYPGKSLQVIVCGNDPTLNEGAFKDALPEASLFFPKGNPGEDLCLLSCCDWLIGAPSTFTLVASMYHDTPLYWMENPEAELTNGSFKHFDYLFRHIC